MSEVVVEALAADFRSQARKLARPGRASAFGAIRTASFADSGACNATENRSARQSPARGKPAWSLLI